MKDKNQTPYLFILSTKKIIDILPLFFKFPEEHFVAEKGEIHYIAIPFDLLGRYLVLPYQHLKNSCELILKANSVLKEFIHVVPLLKMIAEYHSPIGADDDHYFNETECLSTKDIEEEIARYVQAIFDFEEKDSSKLCLQIKALSQDPIALSYLRRKIKGSPLEMRYLSWVDYFLVELYTHYTSRCEVLAPSDRAIAKLRLSQSAGILPVFQALAIEQLGDSEASMGC